MYNPFIYYWILLIFCWGFLHLHPSVMLEYNFFFWWYFCLVLVSISPFFLSIWYWKPNHSNQRRKRNKGNPSWKGRSKTLLFADAVTIYTQNPKGTTKNLLELINELSKVVGYNVNIQKSVVLLYTNMKYQKEKLIWKDKACSWIRRQYS